MKRIEELIHKFESAKDPNTREDARQLVQALMDFHGSAVERMMEIVADSGEPGEAIFESFVRDESVSSLLLLYGLHPIDLETRVQGALDKVRPILRAQASNVQFIGLEDGTVHLQFEGKSAPNLKSAIEEEIYKVAADVAAIRIDGFAPEKSNVNGLIQLTQ